MSENPHITGRYTLIAALIASITTLGGIYLKHTLDMQLEEELKPKTEITSLNPDTSKSSKNKKYNKSESHIKLENKIQVESKSKSVIQSNDINSDKNIEENLPLFIYDKRIYKVKDGEGLHSIANRFSKKFNNSKGNSVKELIDRIVKQNPKDISPNGEIKRSSLLLISIQKDFDKNIYYKNGLKKSEYKLMLVEFNEENNIYNIVNRYNDSKNSAGTILYMIKKYNDNVELLQKGDIVYVYLKR